MSNSPRFNQKLLDVPLYVAGASVEEIKERLGLDEVTKLASNESPLGPSPLAIAAAQQMLAQGHRYPGIIELTLRQKLAARLAPWVTEQHILTGNGGTDVLRMITQAFVFEGGNTVMCRATFPMYHIFTTMFGGTPRFVAPKYDYRHNLAAIAALADNDTRLVYLCSPNNPTGQIITQTEADAFLSLLPDNVVVVFDESYRDFVTDPAYADTLAYVKQKRNVLIVRSFSKSAGLANFRVGYAIGPAVLVDYIRHAQMPFNTSAIALAAAIASLDDESYLARHRALVLAEREYLASALSDLRLKVLPSQANFIAIVDPPLEPALLTEALLRAGFIVRAMAAFGLPNAVRITVGTPEQNAKFVAALKMVLEQEKTVA